MGGVWFGPPEIRMPEGGEDAGVSGAAEPCVQQPNSERNGGGSGGLRGGCAGKHHGAQRKAEYAGYRAQLGAGIPHEVQENIFDPFFTTKDLKGSGPGLWVSRSLINRHQGTISFRTSVGPGTEWGDVRSVSAEYGASGSDERALTILLAWSNLLERWDLVEARDN